MQVIFINKIGVKATARLILRTLPVNKSISITANPSDTDTMAKDIYIPNDLNKFELSIIINERILFDREYFSNNDIRITIELQNNNDEIYTIITFNRTYIHKLTLTP